MGAVTRALVALALCVAPEMASAQSLWERAIDPQAAQVQAAREQADRLHQLASMPDQVFLLGLLPIGPGSRDALREQALVAYESVLLTRPDDAHALARAATLHATQGAGRDELLRAESYARRALSIAPESPDAPELHFTLALVHTHLDMARETRDDYLAALRFPSSDHARSVVLGNLADTYIQLGDLAGAVRAYESCVALDGDYALGWLGLAIARDREGSSPWADAGRALQTTRAGTTQGLLEEIGSPGVFFVPTYDRAYYEAMALEAGWREARRASPRDVLTDVMARQAMDRWQQYLDRSPRDDPWRARVSAHLDGLRRALAPARGAR